MPDKKQNSKSKTTIIVTIVTIIGGLIGSYLTTTIQNTVSKREINLKTINFIANDFLKEKPVILQKGLDVSRLDQILQHKETAFIAKELTQHLMKSYDYIDFRNLQAALSSIERRYSYAQIYKEAGLSSVVCENLIFGLNDKSFQLTSRLAKCGSSKLEGIILKLLEIDHDNYKFNIKIYNDQNHMICKGEKDSCTFWIDLGDRLESTPYKHIFLAEYIGYDDVYNQKDPIVALSILKRTNEVVSSPELLYKRTDSSYWDYNLKSPLFVPNNFNKSIDKCAPFFDSDPSTNAQPEAPLLDKFGESILRACGPIRGSVTNSEFEALINDNFDIIEKYLPENWGNLSRPEIISKLKQIWLTHNGFNHVFCGEWEDRTIKGLHYRGRYLQLQSENTACYEASNKEEVVKNHIYTIGAKSADGANWHTKKGYALQQSAKELFILGINAFEKCNHDTTKWKPYGSTFDKSFYIPSLSDETEIYYRTICKAVTPDDPSTYGILTIYPDATPIEEN